MSRKNNSILLCGFIFFTSLACLTVQRAFSLNKPSPTASITTGVATTTPQAVCTSADCLAACIANLDGQIKTKNKDNLSAVEEKTLVTYDVHGDEILDPQFAKAPEKFKQYQDDSATHHAIWNLFTNIIPLENRTEIAEFIIFTDGADETLASVYQTDYDPALWSLQVDIADAGNTHELIYTLIHEFAHLLTLNAKQVPPNADVFNHPDSDAIFNQAVDACPNYFPGEGCSQSDSYINLFVAQFWEAIFDEWNEINAIENDDAYYAALDKFYETHINQFVSVYAPTSPEEDIAESFMYFVLEKKPMDIKGVANQKILFFYNFPELITLRETFIKQICLEQP